MISILFCVYLSKNLAFFKSCIANYVRILSDEILFKYLFLKT